MGTDDIPGPAAGTRHHPEINWEAAERSPEFQELQRRKRNFVVPATIFFLSWYFGFIILAGYAQDFMGETIVKDVTGATARTTVTQLERGDLVGELVRMLGADGEDVAARRHARELLKAA